MNKKEVKRKFEQDVKLEIKKLKMIEGDDIFQIIKTLYLYREGGLSDLTIDGILRELAEARVLDLEFVDTLSEDEKLEYYQHRQ